MRCTECSVVYGFIVVSLGGVLLLTFWFEVAIQN